MISEMNFLTSAIMLLALGENGAGLINQENWPLFETKTDKKRQRD